MKQLPCSNKYVQEKRLKTIITATNNLTDMLFDYSFYLDTWAKIDLQLMQARVFKFDYV